MGTRLGASYVLVDGAGVPVPVVVLALAEMQLLSRFVANDLFVFPDRHPVGVGPWARLSRFHLAGAGSLLLGWLAVNGLVLAGLHYLPATVVGACVQVAIGYVSGVSWIWRGPTTSAPARVLVAVSPQGARRPVGGVPSSARESGRLCAERPEGFVD
jgi:putative flippase GtrA